MEISSCGAGLVLDIGWNGDGSSVIYGLVLSFALFVAKIGGGPFKLCSGCLWDNFGGVLSPERVDSTGFSLRMLIAGKKCNFTGECFETGSTSEKNIVVGYWTLVGDFWVVNGELFDLRSLMSTLLKILLTKKFNDCSCSWQIF